MASTGRSSLKSTLRQSHANYFDNLLDSVATLADGGVMAAGSVLGIAPPNAARRCLSDWSVRRV